MTPTPAPDPEQVLAVTFNAMLAIQYAATQLQELAKAATVMIDRLEKMIETAEKAGNNDYD